MQSFLPPHCLCVCTQVARDTAVAQADHATENTRRIQRESQDREDELVKEVNEQLQIARDARGAAEVGFRFSDSLFASCVGQCAESTCLVMFLTLLCACRAYQHQNAKISPLPCPPLPLSHLGAPLPPLPPSPTFPVLLAESTTNCPKRSSTSHLLPFSSLKLGLGLARC